jgi:hypothetical protein
MKKEKHMPRNLVMTTAFALALLMPAVATAQPATTTEQQVYGSQLMNEQERLDYRQRLRNAPSEEERQQIRAEHHQRMQERARQMGVTLPEQPPGQGMGAGQGRGMGGGGQGLGPKGGGRGAGK